MRYKLLFFILLILFCFPFTGFSQQEMVRMVYFYPKDKPIDRDATQTKMENLAKILRSFYRGLIFEQSNDRFLVHFVQGQHEANDYISPRGVFDIVKPEPIKRMFSEIREQKGFDMSKNLYLVVTNMDNLNDACGLGGNIIRPDLGDRLLLRKSIEGAWAIVFETSHCKSKLIYFIAAHEMGHAFGLLHDFSNRNHIMSYGVEEVEYPNGVEIDRTPYELSECSKSWLRASRFFPQDTSLNRESRPGEIEVSSGTYDPTARKLHLSLSGSGVPVIHQVQLYTIPTSIPDGFFPGDPLRDTKWAGLDNYNKYSLNQCHTFTNDQTDRSQIVFEDVSLSDTPPNNQIMIRWIDTYGNIAPAALTVDIVNAPAAVENLPTESPTDDVTRDSRLRATLKGHTDFVSSVAFSPDGRMLASGSWDNTIRLWDPHTQQPGLILKGHTNNVTSVAFSANGVMLMSGSWDKTVRFWNPHIGKFITSTFSSRRSDETFTSVVYADAAGDNYISASGSTDNLVSLWSGYGVTSRASYHRLSGHTHDVSSVAFSADERTLASGSHDHTVKLWYVETQKLRATLKGHTDFVSTVAFSPHGRMLASGSWDNTIRLWDVATGKSITTLSGHTDRVLVVAFSPNGRTLASGSDDQTIRLWDVTTGRQKDMLVGHTSSITSLSFSPDRRTLASAGGWDNTVKLWDLSPASIPAPTVRITPSPIVPTTVGETLVVKVDIAGVQNVAGYQATVHFDPTALHYVESANGTYLPAESLFVPPVVNANQVTLAATSLSGSSDGAGTLASLTFKVIVLKPSRITLSDVMVMEQDLTSIPIIVKSGDVVMMSKRALDVNGDGVVNTQDLTIVAAHFGIVGINQADVNADEVVDIKDLLLVAGGLNAEAAAPSMYPLAVSMLTAEDIQMWLSQAQQLDPSDANYQRGILMLELLMQMLTPKETALLPNYPNPFNPETWMPYQLAADSDVLMTIYDTTGFVVRTLALGHQSAGLYEGKSRAAYWDGKNELGEPVASGLYFYTLTAGDFTATRKMLIRK